MKEASASLHDPFMLMLQSAFEECKMKKIDRNVRRGYPPKKINDKKYRDNRKINRQTTHDQMLRVVELIEANSEIVQYPWTAMGTIWVQTVDDGLKILGAGTVIGQNYIITARFTQLSAKNIIWFEPFATKNAQKLRVESIYPSYYAKEMGQGELFPQTIAVLQFNECTHLENIYGSLGYHFGANEKQKKIKDLILAGIVTHQSDRQQLIISQGRIQSKKNLLSYKLSIQGSLAIGSPIMYKVNGEYMICGIHLGSEAELLKGIMLSKEMFDKLSKFTSQNYGVDLSHKTLREKQFTVLEKYELKKIVSLDLEATLFATSGCKILARANLSKLKELNLSSNRLTDDQMHFVASTPWKDLNYLYSSFNRLTSVGIKELSKSTWKNLIYLSLNNNNIASKGMIHFAKNDWRLLETLLLQNTQFDNECCQKLRKCLFPSLKGLSLRKNKIKEEGMKWLSKADWPILASFDISRNVLKEEGIKCIVTCEWTKYCSAYLGSNHLKWQIGVRSRLKSKFKNVQVS